MKQHSYNAAYLAEKFEKDGLKTVYPGLKSHPSHQLYSTMINPEFGYGGMMTVDVGSLDKANALMELMQEKNLGYLAVSLGFYKTLFSAPGSSTSSEIPAEEQKEMGLSDGLIRFSIGLDNDIERTYQMMKKCNILISIHIRYSHLYLHHFLLPVSILMNLLILLQVPEGSHTKCFRNHKFQTPFLNI